LQSTTGLVLSATVTVAEQLALLPWASLTVRVTRLDPLLAHVKVLLAAPSIKRVVTPQLSVEPLSISAAFTVTDPLALRLAVIFLQTAVGLVVSLTVTVAWQVALLLAASWTCNVTVCGPVSPQPNVTEAAKLASPAVTVPLAIL